MTQFQRMPEAKQRKDKREYSALYISKKNSSGNPAESLLAPSFGYTVQNILLGPLHRTISEGHCTDWRCKNNAYF